MPHFRKVSWIVVRREAELSLCSAGSEEWVEVEFPFGDVALGQISEEHEDLPTALLVSYTQNYSSIDLVYT